MKILEAAATKPLEGGATFPLSNRIERAAWGLAWAVLASWTPPPLHAWRRLVLRAFGARLGPGVRVYGSVRIWLPRHLEMEAFACLGPRVTCYNQGPIRIGRRAVVSQGTHLCTGTHDIADPDFQLVTRPIAIGDNAWVAAEAFVGPGVTIGEGAVVGARAVLVRDAEPWTVYAGNPARAIKRRSFRTA
jgi:putative colanic acid biosynthesis acetyltransferase WcaF